MKDKKLFSVRYKKPGMKHLKPPVFDSKEMECVEAYTLEDGRVIHNGKEMEYLVIMVYFDERD